MKEMTYTQIHLDEAAYTRGLDIPKAHMRIHTLSHKEMHVHWVLVHAINSLVFGPMVLDHGISSKVLIPSIGSMVLLCYGFGPWYCERPKSIKEEGDQLANNHLNY